MLLDNRGGARSAIEHLLAPGPPPDRLRRRPRRLYTANERLQGYRDALDGAGVAIDQDLVRLDTHSADPAERVVRELLALAPDRRPTAIFTGNNRHTVGALRALRGLEHEVALVGFDDFELADLLVMPTTVVRHDSQELGAGRRRPRLHAARRPRRAAPPRRGPHRARDPRIRGGPSAVKPLVLPPNVQHHFYAGGRRIAELRGLELDDDHTPEEWIGAVNTMFGQHERGLSRLDDGTFVRDAIAADPEGYLGPEHVARWGADAGLLVKLLDAGERLPVHFHPSRAFARRRSAATTARPRPGSSSRPSRARRSTPASAEDVDLDTVRGWMDAQDTGAMLAALRELTVAPGDAIFVPGGTPHAIGEGILLVELQEPEDLSINLEWAGFPLTSEGSNLGLGWDRALEALDRTAWDDERLAGITRPGAAPSVLARRRPLLPRGAPAGRRAARRRLLDPRRHSPGRARCAPPAARSAPRAAAPCSCRTPPASWPLTGEVEALRRRPPARRAGRAQ